MGVGRARSTQLDRPTPDVPPIVQYWHAELPPERIARGLASFRERNARHLIFDAAEATEFIATHLSAREVAAFRACAVPAMQADYFRYCAILVLGGVYCDADYRCVADPRSMLGEGDTGVLFGRSGPLHARLASALGWPYDVRPFRVVGNNPFAFRAPGHPLLELALSIATANVERRLEDGARGVWLTAGPAVFTSMYLLHLLGSVDAFLEYSTGTILARSAPVACEVVGTAERVAAAFDGVVIRPRETALSGWMKPLERDLGLDETECHWTAVEGSIFK